MNTARLYEILSETTVQMRKGEVIHGTPELVEHIKSGGDIDKGPGGVVTFDMMPRESDATGVEKVDLEFLVVGVDQAKAAAHRDELVAILNDWPQPGRLQEGPSYIEVGGIIGDQGAAFQLFALGKVLGLWDVITPARLGVTGSMARELAGSGYIMTTGYHPDQQAAA